jgi:hypothetical protein
MLPMSPDSISHASRIIRLEWQVRRAQAIACGGALLAVHTLGDWIPGNARNLTE